MIKPIAKIKRRFCRHTYPEKYEVRFQGLDVIFYRTCPKCGKQEVVKMPITNIELPMKRLQVLRKNYKVK